jgi:hypothetical protein
MRNRAAYYGDCKSPYSAPADCKSAGTDDQVIVPSNTNVFMHAEENIVIDGEFEISNGSQMSLSVHACPE